MDGRSIDTDDEIEIGDEGCGILEIMKIGRPIDQLHGVRWVKRLYGWPAFLQAEELDIGNPGQRGKLMKGYAPQTINRIGVAASPNQSCLDPPLVSCQSLGPTCDLLWV